MSYVGDRVLQTTGTTGTGILSLIAAPAGLRNFLDVASSGDTVYYLIETTDRASWEGGYGVITSGSPPTLTRNPIVSSNANALVNFPSGTKNVVCSLAASKLVFLDESGKLRTGANTGSSAATIDTITGTTATIATINNDVQNLSDGTTRTYRRIGLVPFAASGTYTKNPKARRIRFHVWAGGAPGAGVTGGGAGTANACGGGGGGEYAWAEFNASDVGTTETVTVALPVAGGTGAGASGNDSSVGTLVTCEGGLGAQAGISSATATVRNEGLGGRGGTTSGLAVAGMRFAGSPGAWAQVVSSSIGKSGWGGASGSGGNGGNAPGVNATANGEDGLAPGGGGGGAGLVNGSGVARSGGGGAAGYVLAEELA